MLFSSKHKLKHIDNMSINVGETSVPVWNDVIWNLGTFLTPLMNMEKHVNTVCRSAYFQLRNIGRIWKHLATKTI